MSTIGPSCPDATDGSELVDLSSRRLPDEEAQKEEQSPLDVQPDVQLQSESDEHDAPEEISADESARLWAEIETETGYRHYYEYLIAYSGRYEYLWHLRYDLYHKLLRDSREDSRKSTCAIYDVNHIDNRCPRIVLQCDSSSGNKVLSAIRQPLSAEHVRIVLWEVWADPRAGARMSDAVGLGLRIQPRFFQALLAISKHGGSTQTVIERPLASDLFVIDQYVVTIAHDYLPANPDTQPVILIARLGEGEMGHKEESEEILPFQKLATIELPKPVDELPEWMLRYVRLLESNFGKDGEYTGNFRDTCLRSLIPLLHFNMSRIREGKYLMQREYLKFFGPHGEGEERILDHEERLGKVFTMRSSFRRLIEDSEDKAERLKRVVRSQMANEVPKSTSFTIMEDALRHTLLEARRCESEILDYQQLQTGELARLESKKSIDLSNFQIEEAKRGQLHSPKLMNDLLKLLVKICESLIPTETCRYIDTSDVQSQSSPLCMFLSTWQPPSSE